MYFWPILFAGLIALSLTIYMKEWKYLILIPVVFLIVLVISKIDESSQTSCTEIWSGEIVSVDHDEEWDEWHEPVYEDKQIKNSDGKVTGTKRVKVKDGYWEHHKASNYIKTSDGGSFYVNVSYDGKTKFNDKFPNTNDELATLWPIGTPTASVHTYENRVQASYSIYNYPNVDIDDYPGIPEYPLEIKNKIEIDRFIGDIPNKENVIKQLNIENSRLNVTVVDEETGKKKSYKEVNMIFVNLGNVPQDYGQTLENYWNGGNKNDFIIAFGSDNGNITWCYPFSWSESEMLKIEVRDYMLNLDSMDDFVSVVKDVSSMVEEGFERKEFSDFEYLDIPLRTMAKVFIWIFTVIAIIASVYIIEIKLY